MLYKNLLTTLILLILSPLLLGMGVVPAQAESTFNDANPNQALCLPFGDVIGDTDCLLAGPAARLKTLAEQGFTLPEQPFFASLTPYELNYLPFGYAKVSNEEIPLYGTLGDVENQTITSKLPTSRTKYVALLDKAETAYGVYYQIANEKWLSADYIQKVGVPNFQGYVLKKNPGFSFGWVINETIARSEPGYGSAQTGREYWRFDEVRFYDSQMVNNVEWVMVGPDEWIEHNNVARVVPNYTVPEGVQAKRWIEVNLYEQVLTVYEDGNLLFATLISTGVDPFFTQPGVFQIYKKLESDPMRGTFETDRSDYYYLEKVPYILYYDQARALHGAYWHGLLGYQQSHGCVNLSVADAHWLYDWANESEYVYVWDPSGETPTDPSYYGAGGF